MSRWKASSVHLALSILITGTIAAVLMWRWYPPGLFHMAQADRLLVLLGGIDVVLGPLLTLIVFRQGKSLRALRFDLSVIALLQLSALAYGLHTVWLSRPVYLVASEHKVDLVFANEIEPEKLAKAPREYRRLPAFGARTVGMLVPAELNSLWARLAGERNEVDPSNYWPSAEVTPLLKANARPVDRLLPDLTPMARESLMSAIRSVGTPKQHIGALPLRSTRGNAIMLVDLRNGALLRAAAGEWPETVGIAGATRRK